MLGLLLIFFIGRSFHTLAGVYNKHQWGFAILGVASYYIGVVLFGLILGLVMATFNPGSVLFEDNNIGVMLLDIPVGLSSCWLCYTLLKKNWEKKRKENGGDLLEHLNEMEVIDG